MTEKEVAAAIRTLKAYYPYYYKGITAEEAKAVIDVWLGHFADLDYEIVIRAIHKWGGQKTTPPSIVELKQTIFSFYGEIDREYSRLLKEGTKEQIEKARLQREAVWQCAVTIRR